MAKKLFLIPLAVVLVTALIFGGCTKPTAEVPEEILFGCNAPLTGSNAAFGEGVFGEVAAVEDINKLGGVYVEEYGRRLPIKLIVVDNESDPAKSSTLTEDLILREKVDFLASPNQSLPLVIPQANAGDRYKVIRVTGGAPMEPWLALREEYPSHYPYTWAYGCKILTPGQPGSIWDKRGYTVLGECTEYLDMFADQTNRKVALFASDEPDGRGWWDLFAPALTGAGYEPIGLEENLGLFPVGTTDYSSIIEAWKESECEILLGNCIAPEFGTLWRQCHTLDFQPKMVFAARAALYYTDVNAWGGNLPEGVGCELFWDRTFDPILCPGIGGTTPQSFGDRWIEEYHRPANFCIGLGYMQIQVLIDAIERAGTLDTEAVNRALAETDLPTIDSRVQFDENQYCPLPFFTGQWQRTDNPWVWEQATIFSHHDFVKATAEPIFPISYD